MSYFSLTSSKPKRVRLLEIGGATWATWWTTQRLKLEAQGKAWRSFEEVLAFTCPTPLSGICIGCYLGCCILVHLIFVLHHASLWFVWRKVSKLENFLQKQKLSLLIDYNLIVIDYNKLSEACRVKSHIGLIDYNYLIIDYTIVWDNEWFVHKSLLWSITKQINQLLLSCLSVQRWTRTL